MKIRHLIYIVAGLGILSSCYREPEFITTDKGPEMSVLSVDENALMGSDINFKVSMKDPVALSTLKAKLYFDEEMVSDVTIRTKTEGEYEGSLEVPFFANIPNGTASLVFVGQNIQMGTSYDTCYVSVKRPEFEYLTLKTDGGEFKMEKVGKYDYAVEGNFPTQCAATIVSAPFDASGKTITFGWNGKAISNEASSPIPFSNSVSPFTISFNTFSFEGAPFISMKVNGVKTEMVNANCYSAVVNLTQGETVEITGYEPGFSDFSADSDFFEIGENNTLKFRPVAGKYKIFIDFANRFLKVERMQSETELAVLNSDGSGAVWVIGGTCFGKPTIANGASWNPEAGGLCLAEIEPKKHQITLVAGISVATKDIDFKFFHQKTWGGEFGGKDITTDSDIFVVTDSGNINLAEGKTLTAGDVYTFTVDLTSASYSGNSMSGAVLHVEKTGTVEIPLPDLFFAGVKLEASSSTEFSGTVDLTKGQTIELKGFEDVNALYIDSDYLVKEGSAIKFNAVDGKYSLYYNKALNYFTFNRLNSDNSQSNFSDNKTIYMMGWGVAYPFMGTKQFAWNVGQAFCIAQVSDGVYQLTGKAVGEKDETTIGGNFRYDYISFKYFMQNNWGGEMSQDVVLTENAQKYLKKSGNIELNTNLTENSTYRLTITITDKTETIDFVEL